MSTRKLQNKQVAVIKVGGDMLLDREDRLAFAHNLKDLIEADWHCVVLHGGGPQLNTLQETHGLTPNKIDGRRITSEADLLVVKQALCGQVNVDLVSSLLSEGVSAFGCHGASGLMIQAEKRPPTKMGEHGLVDFGEVGDIKKINTKSITTLLDAGFVPVIASLGIDQAGRIFNINADNTVSAIAKELQADLLILSTKVGGIFKNIHDSNSRIDKVTPMLAKSLIVDKIITDGMIPKVQEALQLLHQGVSSIVIVNAAVAGSFLDLATGNEQIGTRLMLD